MKKLFLLLIVFIAISTQFACKRKSDRSCNNKSCYTYDASSLDNMISFSLAKQLSKKYSDDPFKSKVWNNGNEPKEFDARCIWFDLKSLKNFIAYIDKKVCENNCSDSTVFGIRFYYAKYPDSLNMMQSPFLRPMAEKGYANRHTLFLVPTYWDPLKNRHIDFDPGAIRSNCILKPIDSVKGRVYFPFFRFALGNLATTSDYQMNHGDIIPPPPYTLVSGQTTNGTFPSY